jgi:hypothetical protein
VSLCDFVYSNVFGGGDAWAELMLTIWDVGRIESYGSDYEFAGVFVYGFGRVGCGEEDYWERYGSLRVGVERYAD